MAIVNGYCTLAEAKARLWSEDTDANNALKTDQNSMIEDIVTSASRKIDEDTHRRFYVNSNDETRTFSTTDFDCFRPGDLVSVTTLKTDEDGDGTFEVTWATTDYQLAPFNSVLNGWPYSSVQTHPYGRYSFPIGRYPTIQIVGKFGFSAVPPLIKEACLIQCLIEYQTKNIVGGMSKDLSTSFEGLDKLYAEKIATYQRHL